MKWLDFFFFFQNHEWEFICYQEEKKAEFVWKLLICFQCFYLEFESKNRRAKEA